MRMRYAACLSKDRIIIIIICQLHSFPLRDYIFQAQLVVRSIHEVMTEINIYIVLLNIFCTCIDDYLFHDNKPAVFDLHMCTTSLAKLKWQSYTAKTE